MSPLCRYSQFLAIRLIPAALSLVAILFSQRRRIEFWKRHNLAGFSFQYIVDQFGYSLITLYGFKFGLPQAVAAPVTIFGAQIGWPTTFSLLSVPILKYFFGRVDALSLASCSATSRVGLIHAPRRTWVYLAQVTAGLIYINWRLT